MNVQQNQHKPVYRRDGLGKAIQIKLPRWPVMLYAIGAAVLLPWTIYLSDSLPTRTISHHWDIAWGGFDALVILVMILTAYFTARKSIWVVLTSSALGTALLVDAWFDILTARGGKDQFQAFLLALFGELPVAAISWYVAIHATRQSIKTVKDN